MTNLSREICFKFRDARRAAGIRQTKLAAEVGCQQSAISMFEKGDGTKLNDEVVEKMAKKFGIELPKVTGAGLGAGTSDVPAREGSVPSEAGLISGSVPSGFTGSVPIGGAAARLIHRGFCPNPECPSNAPYEVDGRRLYRPDREAADPVGGRYCALCGEVLERVCPHCGAPLHAGAVCSHCGKPYLEVEVED